jgi:hypothetical protein
VTINIPPLCLFGTLFLPDFKLQALISPRISHPINLWWWLSDRPHNSQGFVRARQWHLMSGIALVNVAEECDDGVWAAKSRFIIRRPFAITAALRGPRFTFPNEVSFFGSIRVQ